MSHNLRVQNPIAVSWDSGPLSVGRNQLGSEFEPTEALEIDSQDNEKEMNVALEFFAPKGYLWIDRTPI